MILAIDVGNTNVVMGCIDGNEISHVSRMATDQTKTEHEYAATIRQILHFDGIEGKDFDGAIITAVNHSGMSAAVGAITGAILGAKLGIDALPEFYLESLDCKDALLTLAEDITCGTPALGIFDDSWDHKYVQGLPPEHLQ